MAAGELAAAFDGVAADTAQGMEDAAGSVAEFLGQTASKQEQNVSNLLAADAAAARAAADVGGTAGSVVQAGGRPGIPIGKADLEGLSPEDADFIRYLVRTYGDRVVIHDWTPAVRSHVAELSHLPPSLHERVAQFLNEKDEHVAQFLNETGGNAGIYFGEGSVPGLDHLSHLAGLRPRGWPEGSTWDGVPGTYSSGTAEVLAIGTGAHGCVSLTLHEYGHLVADMYKIDSTAYAGGQAWRRIYEEVVNAPGGSWISPYFLQSEGAGGSELFAEAFARYHLPASEMNPRWLFQLVHSDAGEQALKHYFDTLLGLG